MRIDLPALVADLDSAASLIQAAQSASGPLTRNRDRSYTFGEHSGKRTPMSNTIYIVDLAAAGIKRPARTLAGLWNQIGPLLHSGAPSPKYVELATVSKRRSAAAQASA